MVAEVALKKPALSIIILSYNTRQLLKNCLKSVFGTIKKLKSEVIVVDNHSSDDSVPMVKKEFPQAKLIANQQNLGFSRGNNQGIKKARGEYILLLNSDTIVQSGALSKMANYLKEHPRVGVVGCRLLNQDGSPQLSAGGFPSLLTCAIMLFWEHWHTSARVRGSFAQIKQVDWVMGAAMMIRKSVLDQVGLLDEKIFMYMEEIELCYRIKKVGGEVVFYPQAEITHLGRGSSRTGKKEPILNIYKGLVYFFQKHRSPFELIILRLMLKTKALLALSWGYLKNDQYLKETYGQAWWLRL